MKKRLFLLPLLGGFLLASCSMSDLMFWKKNSEPESEQKEEEYKPDPEPPEDTTDHSPILKEEFGDYKLARSVEEGKRYVLGVFRHETNIMRFFSGDYHRDDKGFYPFYLGTLEENTTTGAAEIEIKFKEGSTTEFSMQVFTTDSELPWNGKYLGVYSAKGNSNDVMSVALLDSPEQTEYHAPDTGNLTNATNGYWKFHTTLRDDKKEEDRNVFAPGADYLHAELGDTQAVPKLLGTKGKFVSMDCQTYELAIDGLEYDLAHLYEHK